MRVMVMVKTTTDIEDGVMPSVELLKAMRIFNDELAKARVLLTLAGLKPPSQGKRVAFSVPGRTVTASPFADTPEPATPPWLWEVKDMAEAVEWVKRCPNPMPGPSEIEIRPVYEAADFGEALEPGMTEQLDRLREKPEDR